MSESNEQRQRVSTEQQAVRVRTSPRYGVFMAIGAVVFALAGWGISSNVEPGLQADGTRIDTTPVIGLMVVVGFIVGATLGALVAIVLDFIVGRKTREMTAERVAVEAEEDATPNGEISDAGSPNGEISALDADVETTTDPADDSGR